MLVVVMKTQLQFHTIPGLTWDCFFENKKGYFNKALTFMIIFN